MNLASHPEHDLLLDGGDVAAERRGYERALRLDPNLTEAHLSLGTLLADPETPPRLRDPRGARRHLGKFLELAKMTDEEGRRQAEAWLEWLDLEGSTGDGAGAQRR